MISANLTIVLRVLTLFFYLVAIFFVVMMIRDTFKRGKR